MRYLFDNCALDPDRRELRRGDEFLPVQPKVFDLLVHLIGNRERVVSKDDLIAAIWKGRIVSDSTLTTCINAARIAIGDSGEAQRLIKTLPRKGFRFIGTVLSETAAEARQAEHPALALPDKPSVAVLPFTNMSGDDEQEYFADGITDDIITELSRFSELLVIARNSSFQYKGKSSDVRQIGRELGVRYILEGSIRRSGERVRISAQLVDATNGAHHWAERYDRRLEDVFAVQDEVAHTIVAILAAHLNKAEAERTRLKPPATWQAHDYYMRAADTFSSFMCSFKMEALYETRRLLEKSLSIDPTYARAYALLSRTVMLTWINAFDDDHLDPAALERTYQLAQKAIELDGNLPQAHGQLGWVLLYKRQHGSSLAAFKRALAFNPNFTDLHYAGALHFAGDFGGAIQVAQTNMRLDPYCSPIAMGYSGFAHFSLRLYHEAVPMLRECVARAPNFRAGHIWLAATFGQLGRSVEAREEAAEVLRIQPKYTIEGTQSRLAVFKQPEHAEHYFEGLRKAGLPER